MRARTTGGYAFAALAVALVAALLFFRDIAVEAAYPFERASHLLSRYVVRPVAGLFRGAALAVENESLRLELESLRMVAGDNLRLREENARLREAIGYAERAPDEWIAAPVLSAHGGAAGASAALRVGRGTLDGVAEGAAVASPAGLVGVVRSVSPHTAEILPLTDSSLMVACEIACAGGPPARGILVGGGDLLSLRHLAPHSRPETGSRVFTSGRGGVFPRGLAVGTLLGIRDDDGGLSREGEVRPAVDFGDLQNVFVRRGG